MVVILKGYKTVKASDLGEVLYHGRSKSEMMDVIEKSDGFVRFEKFINPQGLKVTPRRPEPETEPVQSDDSNPDSPQESEEPKKRGRTKKQ